MTGNGNPELSRSRRMSGTNSLRRAWYGARPGIETSSSISTCGWSLSDIPVCVRLVIDAVPARPVVAIRSASAADRRDRRPNQTRTSGGDAEDRRGQEEAEAKQRDHRPDHPEAGRERELRDPDPDQPPAHVAAVRRTRERRHASCLLIAGQAPAPPRSTNAPPRSPTKAPSRTTARPRTKTDRTAPATAMPSYGVKSLVWWRSACPDRPPRGRVEEDEVGVAADLDRALPVQAEQAGRRRRQQVDHPLDGDPARATPSPYTIGEQRLDPGRAVADPVERDAAAPPRPSRRRADPGRGRSRRGRASPAASPAHSASRSAADRSGGEMTLWRTRAGRARRSGRRSG